MPSSARSSFVQPFGGADSLTAEPIRVAMVGCGYWGSKHARVLAAEPGVRLSIVDPDEGARTEMASAYPHAAIYPSLISALPDVDAVVIATPPASHLDLSLLSLRAGKHVLVEKPFTTCLADAEILLEEARAADRALMVGHILMFVPLYRALKARLRAGELGTIHHIQANRVSLAKQRRDANVIWDLAPHDLIVINDLLDARPSSVSAWARSTGGGELEDVAHLHLDYADLGVSATCHLSWVTPLKNRALTVVGSRAIAVCDDLTPEPFRLFDRSTGAEERLPVPAQEEDPLTAQARAFLHAVRQAGRGTPAEAAVPAGSTALDGLVTVAVLEAVQRSLRTQRPASVDYGLAFGRLPPLRWGR